MPATLFLTNFRLAVRIHQSGYPPGSGYDIALSKTIGVFAIADEPKAFSIAGRDKSSGK